MLTCCTAIMLSSYRKRSGTYLSIGISNYPNQHTEIMYYLGSEHYSSRRASGGVLNNGYMPDEQQNGYDFPEDDIIARQAAPVIQRKYSQEVQSMKSAGNSFIESKTSHPPLTVLLLG